jgi:uncharacterized protein (TIGR02453 family)
MRSNDDLSPVLSFLDDLGKHNNKTWFDEHRATYEEARAIFERFVDGLIDELRTSDHLQGLSAKDCVTRINRDIRFSKDKSPYKTSMGAAIAPGGRKSSQLGYHIYVAPRGHSVVAGGLYMPDAKQLTRFRRAIDRDPDEFKRITNAKVFVEQLGQIGGEKLATAPQGYSRTHPEIELLRLKQVTVARHFADKEVSSPDFTSQVLKACKAMKPFLDYLNHILQRE